MTSAYNRAPRAYNHDCNQITARIIITITAGIIITITIKGLTSNCGHSRVTIPTPLITILITTS